MISSNSKTSAEDYASFASFISLAFSLAFSAVFFLFYAGLPPTIFVFILSFFLLNSFFLFLPFLEKKRIASEIESELSFALRSASVSLLLGVSFEKILRELSEHPGELGFAFQNVIADVDHGSSVQDALSNASARVDSEYFKRACFELAFCYEHGIKNEGLRTLADEISSNQQARVKEFSSKLAFLGVVFVVVSCVLPALFGAYITIGSTFMQLTYSPTDILLGYAVFFPLLDAIILLTVYASRPVVLK